MTTLPPPSVMPANPNSIEKKVYSLVDEFSQYIPIPNDRNRLSYSLVKYLQKEGDPVLISIKNCKLKLNDIDEKGLASLLEPKIEELKKNN